MNPISTSELLNLGGTAGLIAALVWAVKFLAARWESSQSKVVTLLETTIAQNTAALTEVRDVLAPFRPVEDPKTGDTNFFRKPAITPNHAPARHAQKAVAP